MTISRLLFLVTLLGLAIGLVYPSWGQASPCMLRDDMLAALKREFNEVPVARGTVNDRIVEMTSSPEGRTWTLIVTDQHMASCIFAAGDDWEVYPVKRGRAS